MQRYLRCLLANGDPVMSANVLINSRLDDPHGSSLAATDAGSQLSRIQQQLFSSELFTDWITQITGVKVAGYVRCRPAAFLLALY
eukprot:SAG31_NODE_1875_length_7019_cov_39.090896_6_plen_85_part_00